MSEEAPQSGTKAPRSGSEALQNKSQAPQSGTKALQQDRAEATLLQRIRQWDTAALTQVYDDYYERIYRYVYSYLGHVDAAEDLTASVFTRLLSAVHRGQSPRKNLSAWLYRVAHNLVVDTFRRRRASELELAEWLESQEPDVIQTIEQKLQLERVRAALPQLTDAQRQVIILRFIEGMDSCEIAKIIGKSEGAVDALQHRALLVLREVLMRGQGPTASGARRAEEGRQDSEQDKAPNQSVREEATSTPLVAAGHWTTLQQALLAWPVSCLSEVAQSLASCLRVLCRAQPRTRGDKDTKAREGNIFDAPLSARLHAEDSLEVAR